MRNNSEGAPVKLAIANAVGAVHRSFSDHDPPVFGAQLLSADSSLGFEVRFLLRAESDVARAAQIAMLPRLQDAMRAELRQQGFTGDVPVTLSSLEAEGIRSAWADQQAEISQWSSSSMQPLRYSINVTLDGCCDHRTIEPDEELHRRAAAKLAEADTLLFGRVTYQMMESAWRSDPQTGALPDWMESWMVPFARTIDAAMKYVVSSTLDRVDWNAELIRGDLEQAVRTLKQRPGRGILTGGVKLPMALAELGLIDEYEFVVHPRIVGHGPALFAGLSQPLDLKLVDMEPYSSGAVAMRYVPR